MDYVVEYMQNPENEYASIPAFEGIGEKSIALYNQLVLDRERLLLASEKGIQPYCLPINNWQNNVKCCWKQSLQLEIASKPV